MFCLTAVPHVLPSYIVLHSYQRKSRWSGRHYPPLRQDMMCAGASAVAARPVRLDRPRLDQDFCCYETAALLGQIILLVKGFGEPDAAYWQALIRPIKMRAGNGDASCQLVLDWLATLHPDVLTPLSDGVSTK